MKRRPVVDRGAAALVVPVRCGSRGVVADWRPVAPARGWTLESARVAAIRWANDSHDELGLAREQLARDALRALASAADEAAGRRPGARESLCRAIFDDRLARRTS